ncbi:hypothetical protein FNV43_RR14201 [Rhamnella rubrinervis]|uniref:Uncharacterized protein n=1 Tax=Rhamnella rubrinervis TaxID=2594499 RepID=A0A8K0H2N3_9ROSA|nr:hypothetical protein FNV43_RR14201 [Rhamnella rubrinervis]
MPFKLVATPIAWFLNMPKLRYKELLEEITELYRGGIREDVPSHVKEDLLKAEEVYTDLVWCHLQFAFGHYFLEIVFHMAFIGIGANKNRKLGA